MKTVYTIKDLKEVRSIEDKKAKFNGQILELEKNKRWCVILDFEKIGDPGQIYVIFHTMEGVKKQALTNLMTKGVTNKVNKNTVWQTFEDYPQYKIYAGVLSEFLQERQVKPEQVEEPAGAEEAKPVTDDSEYLRGLKASGRKVWSYCVAGETKYCVAWCKWAAMRKIRKALMSEINIAQV